VRAPATADGVVDLDALAASLDARTAVVSVMLVNNETGVAQPIDRGRAPRAANARRAPSCTRTRCRPAVARPRRPAAEVALLGDLGTQVRRPEGRRGLLVRDGPTSCRSSRAAATSAACAPVPRTFGIVALAAALRVTHERRAAETARIAASATGSSAGLDRVLGFSVNGAPERRVAGILHCSFDAWKRRPCSSRWTSRA